MKLQLPLHLHCAFRVLSEQRYTVFKSLSYSFVYQGPPIYLVRPPGPARLCRPWRFFQMQVADQQVVIS